MITHVIIIKKTGGRFVLGDAENEQDHYQVKRNI